jgi:hypothetical protein
VNSTAIRLNWISISDAGSDYKVFYKQAGSRFDPGTFKSVTPATTQTVISGLHKFTSYSFRVLGSSSNGNGVASDPVTLTTDEDGNENSLHDICFKTTNIETSR